MEWYQCECVKLNYKKRIICYGGFNTAQMVDNINNIGDDSVLIPVFKYLPNPAKQIILRYKYFNSVYGKGIKLSPSSVS